MNLKPLLISLAVVLAVPNFIRSDINEQFVYNNTERFNPALANINSIDKLEKYVDREARIKNIDIHSPEYAVLLSYFISCRFYHGFSHWKMNENWIAAVGEKITGVGLSCKVQPDDIMKHPDAACSQQALVMMEILKRKRIDYRKVGFPHHYAIEINAAGKWYYFDPNMEPTMNLSQRLHENWKENNDSLKKYYNPANHPFLSYQFGVGQKACFGPVNEIPARHLSLFQSGTAILSKILWAFPLLILVVLKRKTKMYAVKPVNKNPGYQPNLNLVFSV